MSREIELRLRAALVAKANAVTEADLQPSLVPKDGRLPMLSRRVRRLLMLSAPVLAAAAVSGLAVAGVLTPTHHGASSRVPAMTTPPTLPGPTGAGSSRRTATPPSNPSVNSTGRPVTTASSPTLPAGGPVPVGFQPASVTFVSPTMGYVLGAPPTCASPPCTSLLRTTDRGTHWIGVPAPRTALGNPATKTLSIPATSSVGKVRFADPYNGWAFGPGLWVTHDGARTWHSLDVGGQVLALEAGGGRVAAIVADCGGTMSCGGRMVRLLSSPVNSDTFHQEAAAKTYLSDPASSLGAASISLHAPAGFAALVATGQPGSPTTDIFATDGNAWQSFSDPCRAASDDALSSFVAPDSTSLVSLCSSSPAAGSTRKTVVLTRGGKSTALGSPPLGGDGGLIAANGKSTILVASTSAADFLYRSTDSGRTWTSREFDTGGAGFADLGFTTSSQAVVIDGSPAIARGNPISRLLMTTDAGGTWHEITF